MDLGVTQLRIGSTPFRRAHPVAWRPRLLLGGALVALMVTGCNVPWLQFDGGPDHQGDNGGETTINASNVASVTLKWKVSLPHYADGAPVIAFGVSTPSGSHDLALVTTTGGDLVAACRRD